METKPRILIIYTGGTIGMVKDPVDQSLKPLDFNHITNEIPELKKFQYNLIWESMVPIIDSSEICPENWAWMAQRVYDTYHDYDGFVILHGTDTLAYTASALSFMLQELAKPLILTGSQLPIGLMRTDGRENLISAIEIAAARDTNGTIAPGVNIYFEDQLFKGNRTTKYSAEDFNAFISPNHPVLAESGVHLNFNKNVIEYPGSNSELKIFTRFDPQVGILKLFPGIPQEMVEAILKHSGLKGIILETYGSGNAHSKPWFLNILKDYILGGGYVLNVTQCPSGAVDQGHYATSLQLKKMGVVGGSDITTEAAVTKMMYLLGRNLLKVEFIMNLNTSICGEFS